MSSCPGYPLRRLGRAVDPHPVLLQLRLVGDWTSVVAEPNAEHLGPLSRRASDDPTPVVAEPGEAVLVELAPFRDANASGCFPAK